MFSKDFNCFGVRGLNVSFLCTCGNKIKEILEPIPEPDYSAENDSQSTVNETDDFSCSVCGRVFQYEINCGMYSGGFIQSNAFPSDTVITEIENQEED